jgi:serine/threonine protein kinase
LTDQNNPRKQPPPKVHSALVTSVTGATRTYMPGDIVDGAFELQGLLGQGAMGIVFKCKHLALKQVYAIKILSGENLSSDSWARFQKEGRALGKLKHTGIVGIIDMGIDGGQFPYYVMDLLTGETLDDLIRIFGRLPVDLALDLFIVVASALTSAHAQGIVHRDIKPTNLMVLRDKEDSIAGVKIVDFGIARLSKQGFDEQSLTKPGRVMGSPSYMSPEQCQGLKVDERSDIYSLGCTLFEALTGKPPFLGDTVFQTIMMHQSDQPPRLSSIDPKETFAPTLEKAVETMLAKDPDKRYQTMENVKLDLERIKAGKPLLAKLISSLVAEEHRAADAEAESKKKAAESKNREPEEQSEEKPVAEGNLPVANKTQKAIISVGLALTLAGSCYALYTFFGHPNQPSPMSSSESEAELLVPQEQRAQISRLIAYNVGEYKTNSADVFRRLEVFKEKSGQYPFKRDGKRFEFPDSLILGAIRFGDGTPLMATGYVPAPPGVPVYMYLSNFTDSWPEILDKFDSSDLTGLEIVSNEPEQVVEKIGKWSKLVELAFFNSLTKAIPGDELKFDESFIQEKDLLLIDKLTDLQSLGLCSPMVTGDAILKMHLLDTLHTLKLKRITNIRPLLNALPKKDNLHEIWLVAQDITDDQLKPLTRMKNLETLRIRRSALTPASLQYFKSMRQLKHLYLDANWTADEKQKFSKAMPICEFEPVFDFKYWQMFPEQKMSLQ